MNSQWVIVALTAVLVLTTIWYAATTHKALKAAREATAEARRANDLTEKMRRDLLGARIDLQGSSGGSGRTLGRHLMCILVNVGASTAFDVTPTAVVNGKRIPATARVPTMPAGKGWPHQRCYFPLGDDPPEPADTDDLPPHIVEVTYRDQFGPRCAKFPINPPAKYLADSEAP